MVHLFGLQSMSYLLLIMEPTNLFFNLYIFFMVKTNQVFIIYNDFVCVRHDLHHLKCDLNY